MAALAASVGIFISICCCRVYLSSSCNVSIRSSNRRRRSCSTVLLASWMKIIASNQAFQCWTVDHRNTVAMAGRASGTMILTRMVLTLAPSMKAASSISTSMAIRKFRMMMTQNTSRATGRISAHRESISPRPLTRR